MYNIVTSIVIFTFMTTHYRLITITLDCICELIEII